MVIDNNHMKRRLMIIWKDLTWTSTLNIRRKVPTNSTKELLISQILLVLKYLKILLKSPKSLIKLFPNIFFNYSSSNSERDMD